MPYNKLIHFVLPCYDILSLTGDNTDYHHLILFGTQISNFKQHSYEPLSGIMSQHKNGKKCRGSLYRKPLRGNQNQTVGLFKKYENACRMIVNKPRQNFLTFFMENILKHYPFHTSTYPTWPPHLSPFLCYCDVRFILTYQQALHDNALYLGTSRYARIILGIIGT